MVFATALEETFKVLETFRIDWPSCLKVMMDCHFSLLIWAVLAIIWTWSFIKSSVYPYLITTQLIGLNTLRRKEIPQIHFQQGTPVNWNAFQVTTLWIWLRQCQECAKLSSRPIWRIANIKYILICLTLFWLLHDSMGYFIVLVSSLIFHNLENSKKLEKLLNEKVCPNFWLVLYITVFYIGWSSTLVPVNFPSPWRKTMHNTVIEYIDTSSGLWWYDVAQLVRAWCLQC